MNEINITQKQQSRQRLQILLLLFVFGGLFGFVYEEIFYRIDLGYFVKRGTTFGPWIPIYGFGTVFIAMATDRWKKNPAIIFILSAAISGLLEFITGYVVNHTFGIRLWDYNTEIWNWCNISGYVCLRSVLFFAIYGVCLRYMIYPRVEHIVELCSQRRANVLAGGLSGLCILDVLCSLIYRLLIK